MRYNFILKAQKQPPEVFYKRAVLKMFYKRAVLKMFAIFTGKHLRWSLFSIELEAFRPATLF